MFFNQENGASELIVHYYNVISQPKQWDGLSWL